MQVSLVFDDLAEFVTAYRGRISVEGMLVDCRELHPEGSVLGIAVSLSDGLTLVHGKACVLAVRQLLTSSGALYRTLVRFVELDAESERFVERLVEQATTEGVRRFSVEDAAARLSAGASGAHARVNALATARGHGAEQDEAATGERRSAARGRSPRPRHWQPLLVVAAVVAALAVAAAWLAPRFLADDGPDEAAPSPTELAPTSPPLAAADQPTPTADLLPTSTPEPSPTPTTAPAATRAPQVAGARATRVHAVDWRPTGDGVAVVITADGELDADQVEAAAMVVDGQPRYLVKVKAVTTGPDRYAIEVGHPTLAGIRLWLHEEVAPPELHVVLDLTAAGVVTAVERRGATIEITVGPRL